ncbi:putative TetR family transcriptional regulator [Gordonia effusa NBRC 100432]|uniref:Putative TetR family transcriptional regulator n=1 Tax=Gordonia effusa NBRC 100432 TaxID=1077974 RepID=H0R043_9ACTN|nr:TetR family transcriptional regulator [Gordonia effusa]GAB18444.1 putative TetR family transcriptional regulator [Gordonia effusa NBRC 100432]
MAVQPIVPEDSANPRTGLRAKRKERTRDAIRQQAMKLFAAQGYSKTTVEQIAEAAGVSHTTFFRYFGSKEQVVIDDGMEERFDAEIASIESGLSAFDFVRRMLTLMYALAADDDWASNPDRLRLIRSEPALHRHFQLESDRAISNARETLSEYTGVPADDLRLKVFTWAVAGVLFHVSEDTDDPGDQQSLETLLSAVDLLEAGLPLD